MSVRLHVITSRVTRISCICSLCRFLKGCHLRKSSTRRYTAAANAVPQIHVSSSPLSPSSSTPLSSNKEDNSSDKSNVKNTARRRGRTKKQAEKQAQEEEIRRKALATLDKSTKFIAAGLDHSKADPTLSDLDSFKPATLPPFGLDFVYPEATAFLQPRAPKDSALESYDTMFKKSVDVLTSKFSKKQLISLYKQGIERPVPKGQGQPHPFKRLKTTRDFAAEIMRWRWKWPYIKELVDRKLYLTSVTERIFHLKTNEFFLLLGPNGSTFRELADEVGVTLTQVERTNSGFDLSLKGLCYSLDQLAIMLLKRREQIITEVVSLEFPSKPSNVLSVGEDSLRRISKHTDALVEELQNGMFQISALNPSNLSSAKRLVSRTQQQLSYRPPSFATLGDVNLEQYSLFPLDLYRSDRVPLHWNSTMALDIRNPSQAALFTGQPATSFPEAYSSLSSSSIFRIRKIIPNVGVTYPWHPSESPAISDMRVNDVAKISVRNILEQSFSANGPSQRQVTALFGQIVVTPTKILRTSLISPLQAPFSFSELFQWMKDDTSRITFIPEIPPSVKYFGISSRSTFTRLIYRTVTSNPGDFSSPILNLVIKPSNHRLKEYSAPPPSSSPLSSTTKPSTVSPDLTADLRDILADEINGTSGDDYGYSLQDDFGSLKKKKGPLSSSVQIWHSVENVIDVAVPSRPMDIRFSSIEPLRVPLSDLPVEMQSFVGEYLACSPSSAPKSPPLTLRYKEQIYALDSYARVKSSMHETSNLPTTIEEVTDYESNERYMRCLINCFDTRDSRDWEAFLDCCDNLNNSGDTISREIIY